MTDRRSTISCVIAIISTSALIAVLLIRQQKPPLPGKLVKVEQTEMGNVLVEVKPDYNRDVDIIEPDFNIIFRYTDETGRVRLSQHLYRGEQYAMCTLKRPLNTGSQLIVYITGHLPIVYNIEGTLISSNDATLHPELIKGDLNWDGYIDEEDENILLKLMKYEDGYGLLRQYEESHVIKPFYGGEYNMYGSDLNLDHRIDEEDLAILKENLGRKSPVYRLKVTQVPVVEK